MHTVAIGMLRLVARLMGATAIRLEGRVRSNGFMFVTSPDLPGFSAMLGPTEHGNASDVMSVLQEPLIAFATAECSAHLQAQRRLKLTAIRQTAHDSYLAELKAA